jgi:hypothetical protein
MITQKQCRVGLRVKWKSLDDTVPTSRGTIVHVIGARYAVAWDGEDDEHTYTANDRASCISPL